jgi:predicted peptidase
LTHTGDTTAKSINSHKKTLAKSLCFCFNCNIKLTRHNRHEKQELPLLASLTKYVLRAKYYVSRFSNIKVRNFTFQRKKTIMQHKHSYFAMMTAFTCTFTTILNAGEEFAAKVYSSPNGSNLNYRIYIPKDIDPEKRYPLVLFFHGAGERGNDNSRQLIHGAQDILAYTKTSETPAIIIAPQCPEGQQWVNTPWSALSHTMPAKPSKSMQLAIDLLNESIKTLPMDKNQVYAAGLSMGGFGTWDIIQRYPDLFAAAIPVCGGGDIAQAPNLTKLPIWAFHGGADTTVKTVRSRDMIDAIKKAGGKPKYTEYEGVGHDAWSRTFSNDDVMNWMFSQKKK